MLELTAALAVVWALVRRDLVVVGLAVGVGAWVVIEIAFSLHGWPGLARYMFEPAGVVVALAGAGVRAALADPPRFSGFGIPDWVWVGLVVVIVIALRPPALNRVRFEHRDIRDQRLRTAEIEQAPRLGRPLRLGGPGRFYGVRRAVDPPGVPDDPG